MNRKTTHYISVLLTACVTLLAGGSCGDSLDADQTIERIQPDGNEGFTLEKAKSAFEAEYDGAVKVPMDETHFESPFVWESGDILPVWKLAERHEDVNTDYFSVPILTSRRYYATCESRNDADLIKCRQELLISRKASGKTTSRIVFHIPTDNTRPDDDRTHFTGLLVYTDLNGKFRKIERYENGTLVNGVYFGEKESAIAGERHFILVNQIMEGITVFKVGVPSVTLRSAPTDTVEINDTIAGSICIGDCSPDQCGLIRMTGTTTKTPVNGSSVRIHPTPVITHGLRITIPEATVEAHLLTPEVQVLSMALETAIRHMTRIFQRIAQERLELRTIIWQDMMIISQETITSRIQRSTI